MKVHNPLFYIKNIYTKCSKLKLILDFFQTSKMGRIENGVENVFNKTKCLKYQLRLFLIKASVQMLSLISEPPVFECRPLSQKSQCLNGVSYLRKASVRMLSLISEKPVFECPLLSQKRQCSNVVTYLRKACVRIMSLISEKQEFECRLLSQKRPYSNVVPLLRKASV